MSATYAPDIAPNDDTKAHLALYDKEHVFRGQVHVRYFADFCDLYLCADKQTSLPPLVSY